MHQRQFSKLQEQPQVPHKTDFESVYLHCSCTANRLALDAESKVFTEVPSQWRGVTLIQNLVAVSEDTLVAAMQGNPAGDAVV